MRPVYFVPSGVAGGLIGNEKFYGRAYGIFFKVFIDGPARDKVNARPPAVAVDEPVQAFVFKGRVDGRNGHILKLGRE
jgi:hypothetical protein